MAFSLILLMPSWGSAANGLMTFNGSWHLLRTDPAAKFMVVSLVFYAAATLEGSMMAIRTVNSLSHYTEWTVAHVHSGALGWVAMITIGSLYAMAPRALGRPGDALARRDGAALLAARRRRAAVRVFHVDRGNHAGADVARDECRWLADDYPFIDSLIAISGLYGVRWFSGLLILGGMVVMAWNLWHTAAAARAAASSGPIPVPIPEPGPDQAPAPLPAHRLTGAR